MVDIHTHAPHPGAIGVVCVTLDAPGKARPTPPYAAGIHPWDAGHPDTAALLAELEADPGLMAVGETGLDYARDTDRAAQRRLFEAQLEIAVRRGLPVIIHCVKALDEALRILARHRPPHVVFHGFTGNFTEASRALGEGCYLSMGHRTMRSPAAIDTLRRIPADRLFLETDTAQITIGEMYEFAARQRNTDAGTLAGELYENYKTFFGCR